MEIGYLKQITCYFTFATNKFSIHFQVLCLMQLCEKNGITGNLCSVEFKRLKIQLIILNAFCIGEDYF